MSDTIPDTSPATTRLPTWMQDELTPADTTIHVGEDGSVAIEQPDDEPAVKRKPAYLRHDFEENLAEHLTDPELRHLASQIQIGIDSDKDDRRDWEDTAAKAVEYLGLAVLQSVGDSAESGDALSKVWDPLMLEATVRFWSNAVAEFLPAAGPAKVRDDSPPPVKPGASSPSIAMDSPPPAPAVSRDELAQSFEKDFNHYLTTTDRSYYRDFSRMLFSLGAKGTEFRKIYWCPLRGRPVSEWVKASNLVVSSDATDLSTAARVTQIIKMSQNNAKRLQRSAWWRAAQLMTPHDEQGTVDRAEGDAEGVRRSPTLPEDHQHTIQECYLELDLPGFEHTDGVATEPTGMPLPYRVTLDLDSRCILEIRRNWRENDALFQPRQRFVMFGMIPGLGFYYLGFMHILGNGELTLTSVRRQLLDAGQFANFPAFLIAKGMTRQVNTDIRPDPGQGIELDTMGKPLRDVVMPVPYQGPSQALMQMAAEMRQDFMSLAGVGNAPVGEGSADIPVGTILAMIEQSTKVMAAVHKGLHASRAEELEALRELIAEDPAVLTRYNKKPARQWEQAEEFEDLDLVPSSDPNVPSQLHRIMHAVALIQIASMAPGVFDMHWVAENALRTIGFEVPDEAFAAPQQPGPPPGPPPDPAKQLMAQAALLRAQTDDKDSQRKAASEALQGENDRQEAALEAQNQANKLSSQERIAEAQQQTEHLRLQAQEVQSQRAVAQAHVQHTDKMGLEIQKTRQAAAAGAGIAGAPQGQQSPPRRVF